MATTDTTTILSIDPLQDTFKYHQDNHHLPLRHTVDSFVDKHHDASGEMVKTVSTTAVTSPTSTLSSSSSKQTTRTSLPSLWSSGGNSSTSMESSSSVSTLWSSTSTSGDLPLAHTTTAATATIYDSNHEKNEVDYLQQQRRQSLDSFPQGRYRLATSLNHINTPSFVDQSLYQTKKQHQWHESANGAYGQHNMNNDKSTTSWVDWMASPSLNYTSPSCHPFRSIWSTSPVEQHQPSHQRRMSLSSDKNLNDPSLSDAHHRNLDQMYSYGRRHSLAGPLMNKSPPPPTYSNKQSTNPRQQYPGMMMMNGGDHIMNVIDEFDTSTTYSNAQYSRRQQLELNKRILDHIDEYFGGSGNNGKGERNYDQGNYHHLKPFLCAGTTITPYSPGNNHLQHCELSYMGEPYSNGNTMAGQTMTAGGDAANFGSSTVLMGKGIPLHHFLNSSTMLYTVEFKANRTDICYIMQGDPVIPKIGDLVIVEADRGHDLGKVVAILTANDIIVQQQQQQRENNSPGDNDSDDNGTTSTKKLTMNNNNNNNNNEPHAITNNNDSDRKQSSPPAPVNSADNSPAGSTQKLYAKRLYRLADTEEKMSLATKKMDEEKALMLCQAKIQQKELPMQVMDAEYQWDRRKLTFYFLAEQRIDFRELVRELFKSYKTRIWMCALKPTSSDDSSAINE